MSTAKTALPSTGSMLLKNVRLTFAQGLFEASTIPGQATGKPKFNCGVLLGPDHPQLAEITAKMKAVATEKWKAKGDAQYKALEKQDKLALHDGDIKPNYDGYPGNFFLSPSAQDNAQPSFFDQVRNELTLDQARKLIYSGCYVNIRIDLWAQDNQYGQRINAGLRGVQFYKDGDAFSAGRPADSNEFEDVSEGSDSDDIA